MAGFIGLLAFWVGGAAAGDAAASTAVADYPVRSRGVGRRKRFFVDIDGKRVYGSPDQLQRIVDARTKPPLAPALAPARQPELPPAPVAPAADLVLPDLSPIDLTAYREAKARAELEALYDEEAALLLLLS